MKHKDFKINNIIICVRSLLVTYLGRLVEIERELQMNPVPILLLQLIRILIKVGNKI